MTICSTAFVTLGKAQARALGAASLPIVVIPHPFGVCTRDEVQNIAATCVDELVELVTGGTT